MSSPGRDESAERERMLRTCGAEQRARTSAVRSIPTPDFATQLNTRWAPQIQSSVLHKRNKASSK
eukprot:1804587-Pleurochrysis_carterae.AAC.2